MYGFSAVCVLLWFLRPFKFANTLSHILHLNGFLQYGFLCGIPECFSVQRLCDINCTCMVFLQYGFLCGIPECFSVQRLCDINCTCMVFSSMGSCVAFQIDFLCKGFVT